MSLNNWLEFLGASFGLVGVWLASANKSISWGFQLPACLLYAWIFYSSQLLADSLLQIWFFLSSLLGLVKWSQKEEKQLPISKMTAQEWPMLLIGNVVGIALLYGILAPSGQAKMLGIDTLCAVLSVTAQRLLVRRKIENWLFWMVVNSLYLWIYWKSELYFTFVFYVVLLVLAIRAYLKWRPLSIQTLNPQA